MKRGAFMLGFGALAFVCGLALVVAFPRDPAGMAGLLLEVASAGPLLLGVSELATIVDQRRRDRAFAEKLAARRARDWR